MRGRNIVKICTIVGFVLGVILAALVALPPRLPGRPSSMFVPPILVPHEENVPPGTQPPMGTRIGETFILAFFMGPFGGLAGCGVGLLLDGALRKFRSKPPEASTTKQD